MKKILVTSIFTLSIFLVKAQTGTYDNVFFTNLYGGMTNGSASEQTHYHISNINVPNEGWVLDTKWWGGINMHSEGGYVKLKSTYGTLFLSQGGNLGINTETPSRPLTVSGDIYAKGTSALSFQDDARFTVTPSNVSTLNLSSVSVPQYGFIAPSASNSAELWIAGHAGIRMFTGGDSNPRFYLSSGGNAAFQGKVEAKEVKVTQSPTADFVFEENYDLLKLEDVEKYIIEKKHLPEIASARDMEKEGVNIGEFQIKLLQKIEELTLYSIEQHKQIKNQSEEIRQLKKENKSLRQESEQVKTLSGRIAKLEQHFGSAKCDSNKN